MSHETTTGRWTLDAGRWRTAARANVSSIARTRWLLLAIVLVAVGLRLWFIELNPIDASASTADDGDYYRRALQFAVTGQYLDDSWLIRPPLHVFFFALCLRIGVLLGDLKSGMLLIKLAQVGLGALQVTLGYGVAQRLFRSRAAGLLFALFLAVWFPFVEQPSVLFSELLYATLFLAHYWLLLRYDTHQRWGNLALSGVCLGLAALTRSPALYSLAFVVLWLVVRWWQRRRIQNLEARSQKPEARSQNRRIQNAKRKTQNAQSQTSWFSVLGSAVLVVTCCLAIVLPWTARNYVTYQRFIPVDTLGQINVWLDFDAVDQRNPHIDELRALPQADRAAYAMSKARVLIAADPLLPFRNIWPTFRHIWKAQFVEDYYLKESFYDRPLRAVAPLGLAGDVLWLVFTAAGLAGLASPPREGWHDRLFALAWVGYTLFTVVVFHVEPRYLLPLWLLIALYGSGQLAQLVTTDDRRPTTDDRRRRLVSARHPSFWIQSCLLVGFATLLVTYRNYPAIIGQGVARESAMARGDNVFARGNYPAAAQAYQDAAQIQPTFLDAQVDIGLALLAQGKRAEAAAAVAGVKRRTAWLVGLVATGGGPDQVGDLNHAEVTTGLDIQRWALDWTRPAPARAVHLGDGRDYGYVAGFSLSEGATASSFRWLSRQGEVRLPLSETLHVGDSVALRLAAPHETPVEITLGTHKQTLVVTAGGWRTYVLPVPAALAGQQSLAIRLRAPTFIPAQRDAANTDLRQISVMVSDVFVR